MVRCWVFVAVLDNKSRYHVLQRKSTQQQINMSPVYIIFDVRVSSIGK